MAQPFIIVVTKRATRRATQRCNARFIQGRASVAMKSPRTRGTRERYTPRTTTKGMMSLKVIIMKSKRRRTHAAAAAAADDAILQTKNGVVSYRTRSGFACALLSQTDTKGGKIPKSRTAGPLNPQLWSSRRGSPGQKQNPESSLGPNKSTTEIYSLSCGSTSREYSHSRFPIHDNNGVSQSTTYGLFLAFVVLEASCFLSVFASVLCIIKKI